MAFSRAYDDPARVMTQVKQSTDPCLYYLNQPGFGDKPYYFDDVNMRIQKWGANLCANKVNAESELLGLNQVLSRDCVAPTPFKLRELSYPVYDQEVTAVPRTTNPAWTAREQDQSYRAILPVDPQWTAIAPFHSNVSTRILEKNSWFTSKQP